METDSWLEDAANGLMGSQVNLLFVLILVYFYVDIFWHPLLQIIKKDGQLKFLVDVVLGIKFSMTGTYQYVLFSIKFDYQLGLIKEILYHLINGLILHNVQIQHCI